MSRNVDLSVTLRGVRFRNPVMPASGAYDYFDNNVGCFPMDKLGAIMIKSVHRQERPGNPAPRIVEVCGGMINAVGIPSIGIERFMAEEMHKYEDIGTNVVLSISGSLSEHYCQALDVVADDSRLAAIEMNLSCPNVGSGLPFSSDPDVLRRTVEAARRHTKLPLIVKLSPNVSDIRVSAKAAEESGADAITVSNTFRAMKIDINKRKPALGNISGGLSGPAIKAQNMFLVWQAYQTVDIPIIASGGVTCWEDAVEYVLAGATMIQVGCANFTDPMCMQKVIDGLDAYMERNGFHSLAELRGLAHSK